MKRSRKPRPWKNRPRRKALATLDGARCRPEERYRLVDERGEIVSCHVTELVARATANTLRKHGQRVEIKRR